MMDHKISTTIHVTDIFHFKDKTTVFVGKLVPHVDLSFPVSVSILTAGKFCRRVTLQGYRMPGDHLPEDHVVVYTDDSVDLDKQTVQSGECLLVISDYDR